MDEQHHSKVWTENFLVLGGWWWWSALKVLVQARGQLTENGGSLILRNPSRAAHRLLTVAGAKDLLETDAQDRPGSN